MPVPFDFDRRPTDSRRKDTKSKYLRFILVLVGMILIGESKSRTEYSTDEYWVAVEYHHVYEQYSGEIVDMITDGERCYFDDDLIIVETVDSTMYGWGVAIVLIFGTVFLPCFVEIIRESEWWKRFTSTFG